MLKKIFFRIQNSGVRINLILTPCIFVLGMICLAYERAEAAQVRNMPQGEWTEIRSSIDNLRHEVNNHESELRTYDEKLANIDNRIDALLCQLQESSRMQKDALKGETSSLEERIASLEALNKGIVADLKQLKTHANDTAAIIGQYKQKLGELENIITSQNSSLDALQAALQSLIDAMQVKTANIPINDDVLGNAKTYRVKAGDRLEKIARAHQTTTQAIKELNGLVDDKIVVGQLLKIPDQSSLE